MRGNTLLCGTEPRDPGPLERRGDYPSSDNRVSGVTDCCKSVVDRSAEFSLQAMEVMLNFIGVRHSRCRRSDGRDVLASSRPGPLLLRGILAAGGLVSVFLQGFSNFLSILNLVFFVLDLAFFFASNLI